MFQSLSSCYSSSCISVVDIFYPFFLFVIVFYASFVARFALSENHLPELNFVYNQQKRCLVCRIASKKPA